ncbi:MAG TPA: hypothetical protein GX513_09965 [Firmicutes bacterium]|nr:hypothetical protein [Bacillota bacterium]
MTPADVALARSMAPMTAGGPGRASFLEVLVKPGKLEVYERAGEGAVPILEEKLRSLGVKLTTRSSGPCG